MLDISVKDKNALISTVSSIVSYLKCNLFVRSLIYYEVAGSNTAYVDHFGYYIFIYLDQKCCELQ